MKVASLAYVFAVFVFVSAVYSQSCPGNIVRDGFFEGASYYCRATADDIAQDNINLCTIGYNGTNLNSVLNVPGNQTYLTTALQAGAWVPTGPVDIITSNYQPILGLWALKLNGQFGAGGVVQNITVPSNAAQVTLQFSDATNYRAPTGFSASYQVIVQRMGDATPIYNATRRAAAVLDPSSSTASVLVRQNISMTLGAAGMYQLTFLSGDRTPVAFTDGLYTSQTYYGRTGAIIDSVCLQAAPSPSPSSSLSLSPSFSMSQSVSMSPSVSFVPSRAPSVSASPIPTAQPTAQPSQCPTPIEDDGDDCNSGCNSDHHDTTTINIYFADILNRGY